jgi:hypothetical protein
MIKAMTETLLAVTEQQVAQSKILWWHEEVDRLIAGNARHPAVQACQAELAGVQNARQHCLNLLSAVAQDRYSPPADDAELEARLQLELGAQLVLMSHALLKDQRALEDDTFRFPELAIALGKVDRLLRLPKLLHRGYGVFSTACYAEHKLTPSDLVAGVRSAGVTIDSNDASGEQTMRRQKLLSTAINDAKQSMQNAMYKPPFSLPGQHGAGESKRIDQPGMLPLVILSSLRARQLQIWQKKPPDLLRERTTLTPVAKYLIAWRCKRRYR